MGYALPVTEAAETAWYEDVARDKSNRQAIFAIEDCQDGAFIGHVRLANIDWISGAASFGIVIGDASKRGKGFGREATRLILEYGFDTLNLRRIQLEVVSSNAVAVELYRSLGFVMEGQLRQAYFSEGRYQDVSVMGLLRHEFALAS